MTTQSTHFVICIKRDQLSRLMVLFIIKFKNYDGILRTLVRIFFYITLKIIRNIRLFLIITKLEYNDDIFY